MFFCFVQKFFFGQHKSQNIYSFCRAKREFFFPEFNIRSYDKNSESDYFFPSTKIRIFFSATLGIRIFFQKKNITPPGSPLLLKFNVMIIKTKDLLPHQTYAILTILFNQTYVMLTILFNQTYVILAILFKFFGLSAPKMVQVIQLSNVLTLRVSDEGP